MLAIESCRPITVTTEAYSAQGCNRLIHRSIQREHRTECLIDYSILEGIWTGRQNLAPYLKPTATNYYVNQHRLFSREPHLYKRVCPSVRPSVRRSVTSFFGGQKRRRRTTYFVYTNLFLG